MSVDLDALKAELNAAGWETTESQGGITGSRILKVPTGEAESTTVFEWGTVYSSSIKWPMLDIIRRHVAPAEPVTLTAEEETSLYYQITECVGGEAWEVYGNSPQIILDWLTEHGFRLVRTGGADGE